MKTSSGRQVSAAPRWGRFVTVLTLSLNSCASSCSGSAGLAVDYFNERLYWADAKLSVIGSVRLDGSDPVIAASGLKNSEFLFTSLHI